MYQRDGGHHTQHQQHGRQLERQQVGGVNLRAQLAHVAVVGRHVVHLAEGGQIGIRRNQNHNQRHGHQHADHGGHRRVAPEAFAHFLHVDVEHHHHEQEQHHHRAHIHHHQRDAEEFGLHQHPHHRAHTESEHQIQRGMHRVFHGYGFQRAKQDDGGQQVKQNKLKVHIFALSVSGYFNRFCCAFRLGRTRFIGCANSLKIHLPNLL